MSVGQTNQQLFSLRDLNAITDRRDNGKQLIALPAGYGYRLKSKIIRRVYNILISN